MLALPEFYNPETVGTVFRVDYSARSNSAPVYRSKNTISPALTDRQKNWLLLIDVQNTFCIPGFELYVGGRNGFAAVEDNRRLCEFIYHNLASITQISATLDTHSAMQIFHPLFFVDANGAHPPAYTDIHLDDLITGKWKFNPELSAQFGITPEDGQKLIFHYVETLAKNGKFSLTIWPYHAIQAGIGHALVSSVEEAIFFHTLVRLSQPQFEIKGDRPFTENYSVIGPEVLLGPQGEKLGIHNPKFMDELQKVDRLIIAGQAKSHCVAWTVSDLLDDIQKINPKLAQKVYLLQDCTSPIVVPGLVDHTDAANTVYEKFASAGMHIVNSSELISTWA